MTPASARSQSIAIVVPEMLPVPAVKGGAIEHWVEESVRRMAQPGRRLAVVSRPAGEASIPGVEHISIPWTRTEQFFHRLKERVSWRNPLRYLAKMQNVWSYGRRVARAVAGFDLVCIHNEPNLLALLPKRPGQRIVLHMHNEHLTSRLFRPIYRCALAKADKVICVSDYIRRSALAHFPEYAERFEVVINSTDPEVFRPYGETAREQLKGLVELEPGCRYLLYVGRLTPIKGVHVLIEAFTSIHARMPDTRLIITGSSFFGGAARTPYESRLEALARPVAGGIVFTGFLPHEKLKYLYSAVDLVCLPSVWQDPCPLVTFEAMSSGTCLVASRVGGVPEVVEHDVDGVLVAPDNAALLAEEVCRVLSDSEHKQAMEIRARDKMLRAYTWGRLVADIESCFESLK